MRSLVIELPWATPPLRSNDRRHWRAEHAVKSEAKYTARLVCVAARLQHGPIVGQVTATIVWHVTDRRRRDAGASSPTLKVVLDAAVQAGLLPDDRHEIVTEERCRIEVGDRKGVSVVLESVPDADSRPHCAPQAGAGDPGRESHPCHFPEAQKRFGGDVA